MTLFASSPKLAPNISTTPPTNGGGLTRVTLGGEYEKRTKCVLPVIPSTVMCTRKATPVPAGDIAVMKDVLWYVVFCHVAPFVLTDMLEEWVAPNFPKNEVIVRPSVELTFGCMVARKGGSTQSSALS